MALVQVALVQQTDRRKAIRQAVEELGAQFVDKVKSATKILVKVNLVHHEHQLATSHIDAVRGLLDVIRLYSRADVVVGDASYYGTKVAFHNFGYDRLVDEYDHVALVDLNDDATIPGHTVRHDGTLNVIQRSRLASDCDVRISLAPMKTHRDAGVTLSVKNWALGTWIVPSRVGSHGRVWARWPWLHEEGRDAFHATIATLFADLPCHVGILDGVMAMEGDGPTNGSAVPLGVALAGMDPVAVDAVGATLMGFDPEEIGYLVHCAEKGLGILAMSKIEVPPLLVAQVQRSFRR